MIATKFKTPEQNQSLALMMMFVATSFMLFTNSLMHTLSQTYSAVQIVFFKGAFGFISLVFFIQQARTALHQATQWGPHIIRGCIGLLGNILWVKAVEHLILSDASALSLLSVFWGLSGAYIFLGEKLYLHRIVAAALCVLGALFILKPGTEIFAWEYLYPVGSSLCFGISDLIMRYTGQRDNVFTSIFALTMVMTMISGYLAWPQWIAPSSLDWIWLAGIGLLFGWGQFALAKAYALAEASFLAPFKLMRYPLMTLTGFVIFSEFPQTSNFIGSIGIFAALVVNWIYDHKSQKLSTPIQ